MRRAWEHLGSPDAISGTLLLLVGAQQIAGSLAAPFADITGRVPDFLGVRCVSLLAMFAVLGLGKVALLRFASSRPRPLLTVLVFAAATVAGAVTVNGLMIAIDLTDEWTIERRLLVAFPGVFSILVISGVLIAHARELARSNGELARAVDALAGTRTDAADRVRRRGEGLVLAVQAEIRRELDALERGDAATETLRRLVDDVVRPMSYRLTQGLEDSASTRPPEAHLSPSWPTILSRAVSANPAHPLLATAWLSALTGVFLVSGSGLAGAAGVAVLCALAAGVLSVTRGLWPLLPPAVSPRRRVALFSASILAFSAPAAWAMEAITGYPLTAPHALAGWLLLSLGITWTVTLTVAAHESLRATRSELIETVDALRREVVRLNGQYRLLQRRIARVLHGPVQEAIAASIRRLQAVGTATPSLRDEVRARIENALDQLATGEDAAPDIERATNDLVELWAGLIEITVDISANSRSRLDSDPTTAAGLIELMREACSNAIRHGGARRIRVMVAPGTERDTVELVVENDGEPPQSGSARGLGDANLDARCLHWSRQQVADLVRVRATLPLAP